MSAFLHPDGDTAISTAPTRDLVSASIPTALLVFALPTLGSSVLQSLSGSINAVWVGRFLGEDALAATANGNIVMFLLIAFVFGFGMAATILIGQASGRRDLAAVRRIAGTAIGAFFPVSVVIAGLGIAFAEPLLAALGTPAQSLPLALDYLRVIFVAMPAILLLTMLMMTMRGTGDSVTPLWFMALMVVIDSGLNPVLIAGLGPAPALGIGGAAIATAIAAWTSLVALIVRIYVKDLPLRLRGPELRFLLPDPAVLKLLVSKGLPIGTQMVVVSSAAMSMLKLVNAEGVDTTAAYAVAQQLWTYVQTPAMAIGAAVSAMAAQNIGADRWDRVSSITRWGIVYSLLITGALVALLLLVDSSVLSLFLGDGSASLPIAVHIQRVATWGFLAFGIAFVLFGTVRANGQVVQPLIILFVAMYPVRLGFALGARDWLGVDALWWSFPVAMVATMLMAIGMYVQGAWRKKGIAKLLPTPQECTETARACREPCMATLPA